MGRSPELGGQEPWSQLSLSLPPGVVLGAAFPLGASALQSGHREIPASWVLIMGLCSQGRARLSVQAARGRRGTTGGCSPQFLSSRPLGQSLTPSQEGTQSPFTEQRNSPGQAGAGEVPSGHVITETRADAVSVLHPHPHVHMLCAWSTWPSMSRHMHAARTRVCMSVYTE